MGVNIEVLERPEHATKDHAAEAGADREISSG